MSSASVLLFTDRPGFEPVWRPSCTELGLDTRTVSPDALARSVTRNTAIVVDGASPYYDEDELLTAVGLARALGAEVAVQLPASMSGLDDILEEMCPGLVARDERDVARVCAMLHRQLDGTRGSRFEFVTVSPRGGELLAILGDGRSVLLPRPVAPEDDGSEVTSIDLGEDAHHARLTLAGGASFTLEISDVVSKSRNGEGDGNGLKIDGARLGARLRELRLEAGLTQAELARRTGIHRPNIARVEAGRHTPSLETLARLATAIGVPTTRVLTEE
jgi:DNA-binding XRE family transcriptional regulator